MSENDPGFSPGACGARREWSNPLAERYAPAARYRWERFEDLTIQTNPGGATNWLDLQGIPAVAVLMSSFSIVDWESHRAAIHTLLEEYGE